MVMVTMDFIQLIDSRIEIHRTRRAHYVKTRQMEGAAEMDALMVELEVVRRMMGGLSWDQAMEPAHAAVRALNNPAPVAAMFTVRSSRGL